MTNSVCDNALAGNVEYGYGLGWSFTPLRGKRPFLKGWQSAPRESLQQALEWAAQGNVGLRTGQISGVVAIDVDEGGDLFGLELPATVTATTGGSGMHLYYRCEVPVGNSSGKLGPHIDVRGDGGQVVFPGSVHPDTGRTYEWAAGMSPWEIELAELPEHLLPLLIKKGGDEPAEAAQPAQEARMPPPPTLTTPTLPTPSRGPSAPEEARRVERYARRAMLLELHAIHSACQGARNSTLNRAAFSLGQLIAGGYLDRAEVEQALLAAVEGAGWDYDDRGRRQTAATIRSGIDSGMKEPRVMPDRPAPARLPAAADDPVGDDDMPALPRGQFKLDLYGNADRFVHLFGRDVHWCEERGKWFVWDGRRWTPDALREVSGMAEITMRALVREARGDEDAMKWAARCNKAGMAARETLDVVKHRTAVELPAFDRDRWLLGVANGVIDLRTGKLLPHDRSHLITMLSPVAFDPEALCPRWERFLAEIMGGNGEMISALQRLAGYFLTGDVSVQILPIVYGPGGNGKNVFLDTLMGIMGPHAEEAPDGLVTAKVNEEHPTEIADLFGKRLVVASETEENKKLRIGLVKKIPGNKYLKGRFMRQDYFQFERTHKTVLVTNNKPVVTETSNAIWRRLRLIPFEVTIPEDRQDRRLTDRLVAEWPGILAWAVRGCLDWQARQCDLGFPQAVHEATREYRSDSDHVADFVAECCIDWRQFPEQKMKTLKERLYAAYCGWCRTIGEDVLSRTMFNRRMQAQGFVDKKVKEDGKTPKYWMDLTLEGKADA